MSVSSENVIRLPSQFTIRQIEDAYQRCEEALRDSGVLRIDVSDVSKIDTAGLQLLLALKQELATQQLTLEWVAVNDVVRDAASMLGIADLLG